MKLKGWGQLAIFSICTVCSFFFTAELHAESLGAISGRVTFEDRFPRVCEMAPCEQPAPKPVPKARVVVKGKVGKFRVRSKRNGHFSLKQIPVGNYIVKARGLESQRAVVRPGKVSRVNLVYAVY